MTKTYKNIGAEINAVAKNFTKEVKNKSAFYYLITTSDVEDVEDVRKYAKNQKVHFGHYVAQYKVTSSGDIRVRFVARTKGIIWGYNDIKLPAGNNEGVKLLP